MRQTGRAGAGGPWWGRRVWSVLVLAVAFMSVTAAGAAAAVDAYGGDPNGLVPFRDSVATVYSIGEDVWEVWVCQVPGWNITLDVDAVTADMNARFTAYFGWLSDSRYRPVFQVGGTVQSADILPTDPAAVEYWSGNWATDCEAKVAGSSTSGPDGVMIVTEGGFGAGYGNPGWSCPGTVGGCAPYYPEKTVYPGNERQVVVGAGAVTVVSPYQETQWTTVAHELGHAVFWPHSYGALNINPIGNVLEYDNPVDNMSGWDLVGDPIGTTGYNRYAAGWIDPADVAFYSGGTHTFPLASIGGQGYGMVVIPMGADGYFYELDYRAPTAWDAALTKSGVETYLVDSRRSACTGLDWWQPDYPCFGLWTRVAQSPAEVGTIGTSHVHGVGEVFQLGLFTLSVLQDDDAQVYLRLTDGNYLGRFVDDDGNFHEPNIEVIAGAGLTKGCDPPANDRYCPADLVSRASMAAFLIRAVGGDVSAQPYQGYFGDVPAGRWYTPYVERLFELGITTGYEDGTYRPDQPVSRAEMAAFIVRAFGHSAELGANRGVFVDVDPASWYAPSAELIYDLGITTGCSADPVAYCPDDLVLRDQMASFLARALGLGT